MKYFAYGSNMEALDQLCPNVKFIDTAQLEGYRLAFTRRSTRTQSGVADIIPALGMVVWGVLFEVDDDCLFKLNKKEGNGAAYRRINIDVKLNNNTVEQTMTYTVLNKEQNEIPPSIDYLNKLIQGALHYNMPKSYVDFLKSIASEDRENFRKGLLVKPTFSRNEAKGIGIIKVSKLSRKSNSTNWSGVVPYQNKRCLVKVVYDTGVSKDACELDQNVRHALGIRGRNAYGAFIRVEYLFRKRRRLFFNPRSLILPVYRPSRLDSEKGICVLNEKSIRLLGIEEGNYVRISAVVKHNNQFQIKSISRRVFSGSTNTIWRNNEKISNYPLPNEFYLDLDGRLALGISKDTLAYPVIVYPDLPKFFTSRLLHYGITLFVGMLALPPIIQEIMKALGKKSIIGTIAGIGLAFFGTLLLTVFDLRAKTQY